MIKNILFQIIIKIVIIFHNIIVFIVYLIFD